MEKEAGERGRERDEGRRRTLRLGSVGVTSWIF